MPGENPTESFVESALLPSANHERIPVFYDTVDTDTIDRAIIYARNEGIRNPETLLGKEDVSEEFIKGVFGAFAPQVFANKREVINSNPVEINGGTINEVLWQTDEIKKLLYNARTKRVKTGGLLDEYQLLNGEIHFTSKSAITVMEWTPRCRPCEKCRESWCEIRRATTTHELAHRRHIETMIDNINHRWQKTLKEPIKAVSSEEAFREYWKELYNILDEERDKHFAYEKNLHLKEDLVEDISTVEQNCSCAVVEDDDPCLQNEPKLIECPDESWLESVAEWNLEVRYHGKSGYPTGMKGLLGLPVAGLFGTHSTQEMSATYTLHRDVLADGVYQWIGDGTTQGRISRIGGILSSSKALIRGRGEKKAKQTGHAVQRSRPTFSASYESLAERKVRLQSKTLGDLIAEAQQAQHLDIPTDEVALTQLFGENYADRTLYEVEETLDELLNAATQMGETVEDLLDNEFVRTVLKWEDVTADDQLVDETEAEDTDKTEATTGGWYAVSFPSVRVREVFLPLPIIRWTSEFGQRASRKPHSFEDGQRVITGEERNETLSSQQWSWTLTPRKYSDEPWPETKLYSPEPEPQPEPQPRPPVA